MKKVMIVLLCVITAGMVLGGCAARDAGGLTATPAPVVTNSPIATLKPTLAPTQEPSASPEAETASAATQMTPAQADRLAEQIEEAVERLSEVDDAEAIVNGSRALVGVEFDDQYSAGLDDRMKQMITQAVQKVDDSLSEIEITDDDTLYGQVKSLGERMMKATGLDELAGDFGDLWDKITGM